MGFLQRLFVDVVLTPLVTIAAVIELTARIVGWLALLAGLLLGAIWLGGEFHGQGGTISMTLFVGSLLLALANLSSRRTHPRAP